MEEKNAVRYPCKKCKVFFDKSSVRSKHQEKCKTTSLRIDNSKIDDYIDTNMLLAQSTKSHTRAGLQHELQKEKSSMNPPQSQKT